MAFSLQGLGRWARENPGKALALGAGAVAAGVVLGAGAAGALPGQSGQLGTAPTLAPGAWRTATPRAYAAGKVAHAVTDWNGPLGAAVRVMAPVVYPGMDPTVFLGFTSNGAQRGNTAAANANSFAEMGWFGTTGGPKSTPPAAGPYPYPVVVRNARGEVVENDWLDLHADPVVVDLLGGRAAPLGHNAWQNDAPAQTAVGLVMLKQHRAHANAMMPAACQSTEIGSTWSCAVSFAGWSAGDSRFAAQVRGYAATIGAAPEAGKLAAWVAAVIASARAGTMTGAPGSHARPSYTCLRTLQKIATGRALAARLGLSTAWYPVVSAADEDVVTASAFGAEIPRASGHLAGLAAEPRALVDVAPIGAPPRAWAIVPAHNEGPRVAAVVRALLAAECFARVLVVDDGSTDDTAAVARDAGAMVLRLRPNRGKGQAMRAALDATAAAPGDVVAFFDADLVGLTAAHARALVGPVQRSEFGMVCGLRDWGPAQNAVQPALPIITGERAIRRELLDRVPAPMWSGYRIEVAINDAVARAGSRTGLVVLDGVVCVSRLAKLGPARGAAAMADMGVDLARAMRDVRTTAPPPPQTQAAPPPATLAAQCDSLECVMDAVTGSFVRQAAAVPAARAVVTEASQAAGRAAARTVAPYAAVATVAVVAASTAVTGRALRWW